MVIEELRHEFSLKVLLKVSKLSKSTFEYYKSDKHLKAINKRQTKDSERSEEHTSELQSR